MASPNDIRKGKVILYNGTPHLVLEMLHRTQGRQAGFVQVTLRNLSSGSSTNTKLRSTDSVDILMTDTRKMELSYIDQDGWHFMDPAAAILVAVYIVKFSIEQIIEAFRGLLDTSLEPELVQSIRQAAESVSGVAGIDAVRTREVGQLVWIDLDVLVAANMAVGGGATIKREVGQVVADQIGRDTKVVVYLKPHRV